MRSPAAVVAVYLILCVVSIVALGGGYSPASSKLGSNVSAASNPLCDCDSCECTVCTCSNVTISEPLVVGLPPDLSSLTSLSVIADKPVKAAEPPPGLIVPVSNPMPAKPASVKPAAPSGHWETRYGGRRGRQAFTVWVQDVPAKPATQTPANGNCANGQCSPSQQLQFFSGGCASCGRGRR